MTRRPGGSDGPEDVDAAFAEIVADLEREGLGSRLFDDDFDRELATAEPTAPTPDPEPDTTGHPTGWRPPETDWDPEAAAKSLDRAAANEPADEEHYVPPDPPPLPRLRPGTIFGIVLMAIGIFLLAAPTVIGLEPRVATPLALISMAAGIGWLVLRMRQGPPPDSGWDDGAQL